MSRGESAGWDDRQESQLDAALLIEHDPHEWDRAYRQTGRQVMLDFTARGFNKEDVEDLTQETYIRAFTYIKSYDPTRSFRTWVRWIARNLGTDALTREARDRPVEGVPLEELPSHGPDGLEHVLRLEIAERVEHELAKLSPRLRDAVVSFHQEGLSHEESAQALGSTVDAQKMATSRGVAALRRGLSDLR